jgi:hypothetical protein
MLNQPQPLCPLDRLGRETLLVQHQKVRSRNLADDFVDVTGEAQAALEIGIELAERRIRRVGAVQPDQFVVAPREQIAQRQGD